MKSLKNKKKYTVLRVSGNKVYWREDIPGAVLVKECHFATVDHIIPLQWGGNSEEYNLVPSCRDCNCKRTCDR
ncbi:HNH endonuclease, partial [Vibrio parahaemolyticus]